MGITYVQMADGRSLPEEVARRMATTKLTLEQEMTLFRIGQQAPKSAARVREAMEAKAISTTGRASRRARPQVPKHAFTHRVALSRAEMHRREEALVAAKPKHLPLLPVAEACARRFPGWPTREAR